MDIKIHPPLGNSTNSKSLIIYDSVKYYWWSAQISLENKCLIQTNHTFFQTKTCNLCLKIMQLYIRTLCNITRVRGIKSPKTQERDGWLQNLIDCKFLDSFPFAYPIMFFIFSPWSGFVFTPFNYMEWLIIFTRFIL